MDERKSVKGPNAARDKPMSTDSSTRLEHAAWQDGGVVLFLLPAPLAHTASARPDPARSTAQDEGSMVCSSWLFTRSSIQVQAWPVYQVRPNRGVGLRRLGRWDYKESSSREVSKDRGSVVRRRLNLSMTSS